MDEPGPVADREDYASPPQNQEQLAAGINGATLVIVDGAGQSPQDEKRGEVLAALRSLFSAAAAAGEAAVFRRAPVWTWRVTGVDR